MTVLSSPLAPPVGTSDRLRRLYLIRFVFAAAWAGTLAGVGSALNAASITLLVVYPAFDVAAAVLDAGITRNRALFATIGVSTAATVGLAFAAADDIPAVFRVWGSWAIVAGLLQLIIALRRRSLGGQWALMLSGGISILAGGAFLDQAGGATSTTMCAAYATLGGVFFLVSAIRLMRQARANRSDEAA